MLTHREFQVLLAVLTYYTLTRNQLSRFLAHLFVGDDGRRMRRAVQRLINSKLIARTNMQVCNPAFGQPAPVYYPTPSGVAYACQETEDECWRRCCTATPNWQHLRHWTLVAENHHLFDCAVARAEGVKKVAWLGEWDTCNPLEKDPHLRYTLYTLLSETPRLICKPDAGVLLSVTREKEARKVHYLEVNNDTTKNADRVAAQKQGGYAGLWERRGHLRHFPTANVEKFSVLFVAPTPRRREALRRAFCESPHCWLYKFAASPELTPETLLTGKVWYPCVGEAMALLRGTE